MKVVVSSDRTVRLEERDIPKIKDHYVLIKTKYSAISPGTELSQIETSDGRKVCLGYSAMGEAVQPAVGGRLLSYEFWREAAEIENLYAIKIAPFNRYQTLDVVRAVCASERRGDIALYTGNDDHILLDLLTTFRFTIDGKTVEKRIVGGLLGQWAVWTAKAVELLEEIKKVRTKDAIPAEYLALANELTDANGAVFDAKHRFAGCISGIHEVLRRQGLLKTAVCLSEKEKLSPGQAEEIDRIYEMYPHLNDDEFVKKFLSDD